MKKIPTLFERVFDGHKIVDVLPNIAPGCEEAFRYGAATIKGEPVCKIKRSDFGLEWRHK